MERLAGKVALVTGGGSGIGLAIAQAFLQEGAFVAIAGRDTAKLQRAASRLTQSERLVWHSADIGDSKQVDELVEKVKQRWDKIDVLVNNAGLNTRQRTLRQLTAEAWQQLLRTNLDGAFYCIRAVLPQMLERHDGLIININSIAGKRAGPLGGAAYAAAKFGMRALAICLAAEEKDSGIRVSTVYPGEVDTPILDSRPQLVTPQQRSMMLQPEDVAAAVLFVATLPARVAVPELVIKPAAQMYI
jgi:NADP-dependent 3-hydroxy acid dehydrogenase YdfG